MLSREFARRVQRLEQRVLPQEDEPLEITTEYVGMDGQIVSSFVMGLGGSQGLDTTET